MNSGKPNDVIKNSETKRDILAPGRPADQMLSLASINSSFERRYPIFKLNFGNNGDTILSVESASMHMARTV